MRSLRSAVALLLATAATTTGLLAAGATAAQAGADDVVVMLHGYHSGADGQGGNDAYQCTDFWAVQRQALRAAGSRRLWLAGRMKRDEWNGRDSAELHLDDAAFAD